MARSKRTKSGTRDALQSLPLVVRSRKPVGTLLTQIQDLRSFSFEPGFTRPARLFSSAVASVGLDNAPGRSARKGRAPSLFNAQMAFNAPSETLVCVRRSRRRQVLFARKKTGKAGQRKPRRNQWSSYKC